jgi:hypothetical protein
VGESRAGPKTIVSGNATFRQLYSLLPFATLKPIKLDIWGQQMQFKFWKLLGAVILLTAPLPAQVPVCDLFKDLRAADGRELIIAGELIISKDFAAIGANDCDYEYVSDHIAWPRALRLTPSARVPGKQMALFRDAGKKADRLRQEGKSISSSASFTGRVHLEEAGDLPGEFTFDSVTDLKVETLPDAGELPVIPICELFQV